MQLYIFDRLVGAVKVKLVKKQNNLPPLKNPNLKPKLQRHMCVAYSGFHCIIFDCFTDPYMNLKVYIRVAFPQWPFRSVDVGK